MRLIMDKLKEKPMSSSEIEQLFCKSAIGKIVRRSVQNYMAELIALGLVFHNSEAGVYELTENKKVFQSKHDYDIALKHSRYLTLSTSDKQRLDQSNPYLALDLLVYHDKENRDVDDQCLFQHIKTGYYEVYSLLQKYRKIMDARGYSKYPHFPKLHSHFEFTDRSPWEMVAEVALLQDEEKRERHVEGEIAGNEYMYSSDLKERGLSQKPLYSPEERKQVKELLDLRDLLVGKIYAIVNDVRNGIPLQGYCDSCPDRRVTIKSKS